MPGRQQKFDISGSCPSTKLRREPHAHDKEFRDGLALNVTVNFGEEQ